MPRLFDDAYDLIIGDVCINDIESRNEQRVIPELYSYVWNYTT